ncbi:MAG: sn-glycerol-3-phosphate ABC transporter ATP-binding protein UgpC [Chitinivibrionales bacterium]|nr:sn-glycerol-3-phosphate ABC transporter ATP-binding protein UgpC [Chitinivibrionales bacterium]MBD3394883.1 sn-glycerol-3-phosphate ABC transporter ATP-binding protein UgpC [Chitinivibrionales bacterium]
MAEIVLTKVKKVYPGDVLAVRDIDLKINDKEFVVLVGPSGCGKSTILRMVAGLEEITAGTIEIENRVVNNIAPKNRDIAMVFQDYALYPHMTVRKNIAFGLKLRKYAREEIEKRVQEAGRILGISELLDRKPRALSGGQRQRVAVGRAIVRHPKAFLFDEPLSNLDARLRTEMRAELKRLHGRLQTTTIYVTHDQEEAMTLGDRIVVLKDGIIHQVGTPLEIYFQPVDRFVGGFVGTPPMNFLNGKLVAENGGVMFDEGTVKLVLPQNKHTAVEDMVGKDAVLGVRPETMHVADSAHSENIMPVHVDVSEPLGENTDLYVSTASNKSVVARVESHPGLEMGKDIKLAVDMEAAHVFEVGADAKNRTVEHSRFAS